MLEIPLSTPHAAPSAVAMSDHALIAGWRDGLALVNLRGDPGDPAFVAGARTALGQSLPTAPCSAVDDGLHRIVWAGPDDWFVVGPRGRQDAIATSLRRALAGTRHAVTDVSGGYAVLHLAGRPVREVLAQGCPLDLHPRRFGPGQAAGTHFFKASVWLWQADAAPSYELLVRSSFRGYVDRLLQLATRDCGLVTRRFA